jgi:hypothetical protein
MALFLNRGLFDLISGIQASLDRKLKTAGVFLDTSKAFDSVYHEFLLRTLRCCMRLQDGLKVT